VVLRRLFPLLAVAVLVLVGSSGAARAQALDAEDAFLAHIAEERAALGLAGYLPAADLQAVARRHAQRMADRGQHYHNPDLAAEVSGWLVVAENVGVGPDVGELHRKLMASPTHRANLVNPDLTEVGVGVVRSADGLLWVVQVFRRPEVAPRVPAPSPPRAPAPPATPATVPPVPITEPAPSAPPVPRPTRSDVDAWPGRGAAAAAGAAGPSVLGRQIARSPGASTDPPARVAQDVGPVAWVAIILLVSTVALEVDLRRRLWPPRRRSAAQLPKSQDSPLA
jgi:hypothetical protein